MATYIYSIQDENGKSVEGFDQVQQVMHDFYKHLLGRQQCTRKSINMQVIQLGLTLKCEDRIGLCTQISSKDIKDAFFQSLASSHQDLMGLIVDSLKDNWSTGMFFHPRVFPYWVHAKLYQCNKAHSPS